MRVIVANRQAADVRRMSDDAMLFLSCRISKILVSPALSRPALRMSPCMPRRDDDDGDGGIAHRIGGRAL